MTTTTKTATAAILDQHWSAEYNPTKSQFECKCGAPLSEDMPAIEHRAHLVDELVKAAERGPLCGAYPLSRLEAAYEAHRYAPRTRGLDTTGPMRAALAASDAVMFSEESVERAAKAAYEAQMEDGDTPWAGFGKSSYLDYWRDQARAVIAGLKGEA